MAPVKVDRSIYIYKCKVTMEYTREWYLAK